MDQIDWYEYNNEIPLNTLKAWRDEVLATAQFQHVGWTGAPKEPYRHWAAYPEVDNLYKQIFFCLDESFKEDGFNLTIDRIIVNSYNHGDSSWLHTDSEKESAWTVLLFINDYWDLNWGGDFILVKDNQIYKSFACTPAKFVLFKSNILHAARPVSREAQFPRMAIAFQCTNISKI